MSLSCVTVPITILAVIALMGPASTLSAGEIVDHPDKLKFEELDYDPPRPEAYRHTLESGVTAYIAENRELPTFELTVLVRTGSVYDPVEI